MKLFSHERGNGPKEDNIGNVPYSATSEILSILFGNNTSFENLSDSQKTELSQKIPYLGDRILGIVLTDEVILLRPIEGEKLPFIHQQILNIARKFPHIIPGLLNSLFPTINQLVAHHNSSQENLNDSDRRSYSIDEGRIVLVPSYSSQSRFPPKGPWGIPK